jgi:hypothetical protein
MHCIVTCMSVTVEGFGLLINSIGHFNTTLDYTLQVTISRRPLFLITVFTVLLDNAFQQRTTLCIFTKFLAGWRLSHTSILLF